MQTPDGMPLYGVDDTIYALPEEERRKRLVEVAKDVLLQLDAGKLVAQPGLYLGWPDQETRDTVYGAADADDFQEAVTDIAECHACAQGAAFLSYIRLYDGLLPQAVVAPYNEMEAIFGPTRMEAIEACFESFPGSPDPDEGPEVYRRVQVWRENHVDIMARYEPGPEGRFDASNAEARLRKIMLDIIAEGGTFLEI
jgi:hypothetical protein